MAEITAKGLENLAFQIGIDYVPDPLYLQMQDENSELYRAIGDIIERLVPGVAPFDRIVAVGEILKEVGKLCDFEF
jgi:hypothetical protein